MKPLLKHWRQLGIRVIVYLGDGLVAVEGRQKAVEASEIMWKDLTRAGWVENVTKSEWEASQQLSWLGFNIDLEKGSISVPQAKLDNLHAQLQVAGKCERLHAKILASLTGKLISMSLTLVPVARLMTKGMYCLLNTR